jgi:hypothetical protein
MVLDMLAEGKITADEAEELLKAMEIVDEERAAPPLPPEPRRDECAGSY